MIRRHARMAHSYVNGRGCAVPPTEKFFGSKAATLQLRVSLQHRRSDPEIEGHSTTYVHNGTRHQRPTKKDVPAITQQRARRQSGGGARQCHDAMRGATMRCVGSTAGITMHLSIFLHTFPQKDKAKRVGGSFYSLVSCTDK